MLGKLAEDCTGAEQQEVASELGSNQALAPQIY